MDTGNIGEEAHNSHILSENPLQFLYHCVILWHSLQGLYFRTIVAEFCVEETDGKTLQHYREKPPSGEQRFPCQEQDKQMAKAQYPAEEDFCTGT